MSDTQNLEMLGPPSHTDCAAYHVIHDAGVIVALGSCPAHLVPLYVASTPHELVLIHHATFDAVRGRLEAFHVAGGEVKPRIEPPVILSASSIAADGVAEALIGGIPAGAEISINGALAVPWTPVEGSSVTLTSTEPGRLAVTLRLPPPYLEWRGTINAH